MHFGEIIKILEVKSQLTILLWHPGWKDTSWNQIQFLLHWRASSVARANACVKRQPRQSQSA